jgi:hypothetical protein
MKKYKFKLPKSSKNMVATIKTFFGDGGFITDIQEWIGNGKQDIEFTVECNSDLEFAEICIEVGRHLGKHNLMG